ncbi:MAG: hypothetical protein JNL05_10380 [Flavobacteriales bacterium]|nr:hypothetical protein [Flavobacteriales bacterium]
MLIRDGIVLLEFTELVNSECLSKPAYDKAVREGRIAVIQKGGGNHPALIDWASLPERYKEMVRARMGGDPAELVKVKTIDRFLKLRPEDERYLDGFRASNGLMLTPEKRSSLKKSARVMAMMATLDEVYRTGGRESVLKTYGMHVMELKQAILQYIKLEGLDLPTSFPRLEARKRAYLKARADGHPGAKGLVHGGHGNANSCKLDSEVQQAVLRRIASSHQNYGPTLVARMYNQVATLSETQWPTITASTVRNFKKKGSNGRTITLYARGKAAYNSKYNIVVHRGRPSQPTYMWVTDGNVYELYYQTEGANQKGHRKVFYHNRKVVVVVLDAHSWYPVGYAIGDKDTVELSQQAVRNAVTHMRELTGDYMLPDQVQSDNLGWSAMGAWYGTMDVAFTPTEAGNARAKVIEPYFRHHHAKYVQPHFDNWSGHNVDARKENQPNPDALDRIKKDFPDEAGVIAQIHQAFAMERAEKVEAYLKALQEMPEEHRRIIPRERYLELFGTRHELRNGQQGNTLTNSGLCPTLLGQERIYNLLTREFQDFIGYSFQVVYDPADLSNVLALLPDGKTRFLVPQTKLVPMARLDHTDGSKALLGHVQGFKKELSQEAIDRPVGDRALLDQLAVQLLSKAAHLVKPAKQPRERIARVGANEEATVKAYAQANGSHKAALEEARERDYYLNMTPEEIERRAIDQL